MSRFLRRRACPAEFFGHNPARTAGVCRQDDDPRQATFSLGASAPKEGMCFMSDRIQVLRLGVRFSLGDRCGGPGARRRRRRRGRADGRRRMRRAASGHASQRVAAEREHRLQLGRQRSRGRSAHAVDSGGQSHRNADRRRRNRRLRRAAHGAARPDTLGTSSREPRRVSVSRRHAPRNANGPSGRGRCAAEPGDGTARRGARGRQRRVARGRPRHRAAGRHAGLARCSSARRRRQSAKPRDARLQGVTVGHWGIQKSRHRA